MNWAADEWDTEALYARGWPLVVSLFDQKRADATARYEQLASTDPGRTATGIEAVVPAAYDHRIDVLFVAEPENVWGRYNAVTRSVIVHDHAHPVSTELLNAVTVHTLEGQGTAHVTDASDVPGASTAAAILRY